MNNDDAHDQAEDVCWHGTEDELDRLMLAVHRDTDCGDCQAEMLECCIGTAQDASCAGHSLLADQQAMDSLLFMMRVHSKRDDWAFRLGLGVWWSADLAETVA